MSRHIIDLRYACVAKITDYDNWPPDHGEVDVIQIIATLTINAAKTRTLNSARPAHTGVTEHWNTRS